MKAQKPDAVFFLGDLLDSGVEGLWIPYDIFGKAEVICSQ